MSAFGEVIAALWVLDHGIPQVQVRSRHRHLKGLVPVGVEAPGGRSVAVRHPHLILVLLRCRKQNRSE